MEPLQVINYRSVGKKAIQSPKKSSEGTFKRSPSSPSIPSKWEQFSLSNEHSAEVRAFGSTRPRFIQTAVSSEDSPGPGYYSNLSGSFILETPSLSKKGYKNAFVSKSSKFEKFTNTYSIHPSQAITHQSRSPSPVLDKRRNSHDDNALNDDINGNTWKSGVSPPRSPIIQSHTQQGHTGPGPGYYDITRSLPKTPANKLGSTSVFLPSKSRYRDPLLVESSRRPGPGDYNIRAPNPTTVRKSERHVAVYGKTRGQNAAYSSKLARAEFLIMDNGAPPIGSYEPCPSPSKIVDDVAWSRSKDPRITGFGIDNAVPGPGRYFQGGEGGGNENGNGEQLGRSSLRTVGSFHGIIRPSSSQATLAETLSQSRRPRSSEWFARDSYVGRLDKAAESPGPGWYTPLQYSTVVAETQPSAVFRSTSPLRGDLRDPATEKTPGPAYYNPRKLKPKKFSVNIDKRWDV